MPERIYRVTPKAEGAEPKESRLVRAGSQAQALRHVAAETLAVSLASQQDLVELLGAGVKVDDAKAEEAGES